jgi:D-glycerate 3-kinase
VNWGAADRAVAAAIVDRRASLDRPILVGLAGAQGSGKTTMAPRLASLLDEAGLSTAVLALDDFYLTKAERAALARAVHPLLATRGVPGTHDVALLSDTLNHLLAGNGAETPIFDKAIDDRAGSRVIAGPVDIVLLEGWCSGARQQAAAALAHPINALEREEDSEGVWRHWVNDRLAHEYAALFDRIDLRTLLRAPDFEVVERWRGEQEAHLGSKGMPRGEIARFIAHYERITRAMIADEPADIVIDLDADRTPLQVRGRRA